MAEEKSLEGMAAEIGQEAPLLFGFHTLGDHRQAHGVTQGQNGLRNRAAGRIHSDLERGFIRAEVTHYDDFIALGSEAAAIPMTKSSWIATSAFGT